jgi:RNA polymerase sigma factor (sigma-70 family)
VADPSQNLSPSLAELQGALRGYAGSFYAESRAREWGLSLAQFQTALERSAAKRFAGGGFSSDRLGEYLGSLQIEDLCLANACLEGSEAAWEYFVTHYRGYLRAAAGIITKTGRAGTGAQELADSLFAELFGLVDGKRGERSLFRYFHGRSSLKTWLRAILAQRYVDRLRQSRRWEQLEPQEERHGHRQSPQPGNAQPAADPHRDRYVARFVAALHQTVALLGADDRERLELYYAREKTLAEIGRALGEHESSVSRNLERIRRQVRSSVEENLRCPPALSEAEIALCFQYAAEDSPIDFRQIFPEKTARKSGESGKESL